MGEHIAYEYGKRGAFLVIGARRDNALRDVAEKAHLLGSPLAVPVPADISKIEDCRKLIEHAVDRFGRCNGPFGIGRWRNSGELIGGNCRHHRRRTGNGYQFLGICVPGNHCCSIFEEDEEASKAAVVSFFETLRVEFGSDIGITIVTPGLIESEMTKGKFLDEEGRTVVDQHLRDVRFRSSKPNSRLNAVPMIVRVQNAGVDEL
ncbi:hypothetical protein M569_11562, partial [Genlisea aurea]